MTTQPSKTSPQDVEADLNTGWSLPSYLYSDPAVFELEKELIFRRSWQFVSTIDKLAQPGEYVTATIADIPIVVTRTKTGELKGHVNACLHRLHPIAQGSGCKLLLQCNYHGWTYNLDGGLRSAPRSKDDESFDKSSMKLSPIRVESFGNYVFANADPNAQTLAEFVGNAPQLVEQLNLNFTGWEHSGTFTYDVDANWKLFMENSLECYHCDLVHKDTFGDAFSTDPANYICDNYENVLTQIAPVAHAPATETRQTQGLEKFRLLYIWPSTAISIDEYAGTIVRLVPTGPKQCTFIVDTYARPGMDPVVLASWLEMYDSTFKEDKVVVTAQQAGYDSGRVRVGRLLPRNESSIATFQKRTWQALAPALGQTFH